MKKGKITALIGSLLQLGPVFGLIGTLVGMLQMFSAISVQGADDSGAMSKGVNTALVTTEIGLVLALVGTVFLFVALFGQKYRSKWFYWVMMIYSIFSLIAFPVGTVIGILLLIYITKRRKEFFEDETRSEQNAAHNLVR